MLQRFVITIAVAAAILPQQTFPGQSPDQGPGNQAVLTSLYSMPLSFVQNQGQFGPEVLFRAQAGGAAFYFCKDEVGYLFLSNTVTTPDQQSLVSADLEGSPHQLRKPDDRNGAFIKARLVGGNPDPVVRGDNRLPFNSNFFHGADATCWRTDVPNYSAILYENVYPGIDLKYYGDGRSMKYDLIVYPGADPSQIAIAYDGANDLSITSEGDMRVPTELGPFYEQKPYVYQEIGGARHELAARYQIQGPGIFGFELLSDYDRDYPVVIDPELLYSTFLGGGGWDYGYAIAVDGEGSAYVAGNTASPDFPMVAPYDGTYNEEGDAFVTKFSPAGNTVLYSTYIGGVAWDESRDIAVDGSGNAYITGLTWSSNFPTVSAYDASLRSQALPCRELIALQHIPGWARGSRGRLGDCCGRVRKRLRDRQDKQLQFPDRQSL